MDDTLYEDRSSPTVSTIHLMMIIAAKERRRIGVLDIGNAFLKADIKTRKDLYVELSRILCMIENTTTPLLAASGNYIVCCYA